MFVAPEFNKISTEVIIKTSRSSGPGGQNVNKVESKVQVNFNISESKVLTEDQKQVLLTKYASKIDKEGNLQVTSEAFRSQLKNKEQALRKLEILIRKAFQRKKARKKTKPSKSAIEKRLKSKKMRAEKKKWRRIN